MDLFVKPTDSFKFTLYVGRVPTPAGIFAAADEGQLLAAKATGIEQYTVEFRVPNYRDNMEILDASTEMQEGKLTFHSGRLRMLRMVKLLKSWTFKDSEGVDVPVNADTIDSLHPAVANGIASEMEVYLDVM
jgi:hypothetical protein